MKNNFSKKTKQYIFTVSICSFTESEEIIPWLSSIFTEKKSTKINYVT